MATQTVSKFVAIYILKNGKEEVAFSFHVSLAVLIWLDLKPISVFWKHYYMVWKDLPQRERSVQVFIGEDRFLLLLSWICTIATASLKKWLWGATFFGPVWQQRVSQCGHPASGDTKNFRTILSEAGKRTATTLSTVHRSRQEDDRSFPFGHDYAVTLENKTIPWRIRWDILLNTKKTTFLIYASTTMNRRVSGVEWCST